ncbi:MAG: UDP-galactopyranose mutase [Verrucomicrobiota bacterium]
MNFLVVGSGFSGAVLARQLVEKLDCRVEVVDERPHIGGNCHTERDPASGILVHKYGPHIFNTDSELVWKFVNAHGDFRPFVNRVKACTARGMFSMPINLLTINQFFGKTMAPDEARKFISALGDSSISNPQNFEEQALKMLGRDLYDTFFKGYTMKQWGCDPKALPASVLQRLPVRFNYDDNYYSKKYQGIPAGGYTEVIRSILDHPRITVRLNTPFRVSSFSPQVSSFSQIFYTGPIDAFFHYSDGRLGYRTVSFERIETDAEDFQGNAVINYPDLSVPWTRIHEHKHFAPWERHEKTVAFREFSKETAPDDIPYYPKRLAEDKKILQKYRALAEAFPISPSGFPLSFLGRLATYRYMDMEAVIAEALDFADAFVASVGSGSPKPVFPNQEA